MKRLLFVLFALAGAPPAEAQLVCSVTATPVQFDSIAGMGAGTFDARGAITVTCTGSQGASIAACVEVGASGQRALVPAKGTGALPMQIFQDVSLARPWGTVAMNQAAIVQRTGDGPMSATAYLRVYLQKGNAVPGTYAAQFPVMLRYGVVTGNFADCNALGTIAVSPIQRNVSAVPAPRKR